MTADTVQSLAINHGNGSVTLPLLNLSLPLSQPLSENAMTLKVTKYNTVPTNRSDVTGNIVTEMVTWGTSAVFGELDLITVCKRLLKQLMIKLMYVLKCHIKS